MPIDLTQETQPIDPRDPGYAELLANLQGNVLKSHGRDYTRNLFFQFTTEDAGAIGAVLAEFAGRYVTSALRQLHDTDEYKANGTSRLFANLLLSATGYKKLSLDPARFDETPKLPGAVPTPFRNGMEAAGEILADPKGEDWDPGFNGRQIDAMVLLADEDPDRLIDVVYRVHRLFAPIARLTTDIPGEAFRDDDNKPLEHFGYRDGISQPQFFQSDVEAQADTQGIDQWDPGAGLDLVLVPDPFAQDGVDAFGSYMVFRQLEQNVAGFKAAEDKLNKDTLKLPEADAERVGAMVVGRFENGIPLEVAGTEDAADRIDWNNFNYHADSTGSKCPVHAHIRKTNPRGDTARLFNPGGNQAEIDTTERMHRVARRGITYGRRETKIDESGKEVFTHDDEPKKDVGLLFMCFQRNIPDQFGFMQARWCNNSDFARDDVGLDPIIGQGTEKENLPARWAQRYGDDASLMAANFEQFVTLKGGEFFFLPSICFLQDLGHQKPAIRADLDEAPQGPH